MRKLLLALPLALLTVSCSNFTWKGQQSGLTEDQAERGIKDPEALARQYDTETYWRSVRARRDGRVNAFGRDLGRIQDTIDRHVFNYSADDPYVNYPTDNTVIDHSARFGLTALAR